MIKEFFAEHQIDLNTIRSICTDGTYMLGNHSRFAALLRQEIPSVKVTHCILRHHNLAAKTLLPSLKQILDVCVKVVNVIWGRALNHQLFQLLCEEVGQDHTVLLYHTKVRWLSCGCVLSHMFELQNEIKTFLWKQQQDLSEHFDSPDFMQALAYLSDVFKMLNELNRSLQGKMINIVIAFEKFTAFKERRLLCGWDRWYLPWKILFQKMLSWIQCSPHRSSTICIGCVHHLMFTSLVESCKLVIAGFNTSSSRIWKTSISKRIWLIWGATLQYNWSLLMAMWKSSGFAITCKKGIHCTYALHNNIPLWGGIFNSDSHQNEERESVGSAAGHENRSQHHNAKIWLYHWQETEAKMPLSK